MTTLIYEHNRLGCEVPKGNQTCYWCGANPGKLARAFKGGLTRSQVAKKFKVPIITVDNAIRACLREKEGR